MPPHSHAPSHAHALYLSLLPLLSCASHFLAHLHPFVVLHVAQLCMATRRKWPLASRPALTRASGVRMSLSPPSFGTPSTRPKTCGMSHAHDRVHNGHCGRASKEEEDRGQAMARGVEELRVHQGGRGKQQRAPPFPRSHPASQSNCMSSPPRPLPVRQPCL